MKKHEAGQGLVVYELILVLVAIVPIAILTLIGPRIQRVFCEINYHFFISPPTFTQMELMGLSSDYVIIDVKPEIDSHLGEGCGDVVQVWDLISPPSRGEVLIHEDGTFSYRREEGNLEYTDNFTYGFCFNDIPCEPYSGSVHVIVAERYSVMSAAMVTGLDAQGEQGFEDPPEAITALRDEVQEQEESLEQGVVLIIEAIVEGLDVLVDYADDMENQALSASLTQLLQEIMDGNFDEVAVVFPSLVVELNEAPFKVRVAVIEAVVPRLIASCEVVSEGMVSSDAIADALAAVEALEDGHPGKEAARQLLQQAVDDIEGRNAFIEAYPGGMSVLIDQVITVLENAGKDKLAEIISTKSEACRQ